MIKCVKADASSGGERMLAYSWLGYMDALLVSKMSSADLCRQAWQVSSVLQAILADMLVPGSTLLVVALKRACLENLGG